MTEFDVKELTDPNLFRYYKTDFVDLSIIDGYNNYNKLNNLSLLI